MYRWFALTEHPCPEELLEPADPSSEPAYSSGGPSAYASPGPAAASSTRTASSLS